MNSNKTVLLAAAIAASMPMSSMAQEDYRIEEVVVTAQKRAQSVSDIGVTVTAFGGNEIKELGFQKPQDVAAQTPGLSTTNATSSGTPIFAIRGIGLDDFNSNNTSGVGVYIDEVLAAYPVFLNGQLFDVERVEVLKGPQGTLYGKNTTGGAINYVSVKPSAETEGYITAGLSRWNTYKVEGAVGGAIADSINTRLAISTSKGDGWQEDIDTGREYGDTDQIAARSLTSFELSDTSELLLNLHYSKDESTPISPQNTEIDYAFGLPDGTLGITSSDPRDVRVGDLPLGRDEEGYGASATLTMDFEAFTLTSITAYDYYERDVVDNYDGVAVATGDFFFKDEFEVYSQEFRLTSNNSGPFHWVGGLVFSQDEVTATTTADTGTLIDGILGGTGMVESARAQSDYVQKTQSLGAYLHTETDLTDQLLLTVGVRYSQDKRDFKGGSTDLDGWDAVLGGAPAPVPGVTGAYLDDSKTESNVSGKIGLDYNINEDWLVYGSVATSYKAGLFYGSPAGSQDALSYVEPEEVVSYELGFKGSMLDGTMQINGAWYRYDYDDRQSLVIANNPTVPGAIFATLGNIDESVISGAELEFRWLPTQALDIRAGVSYIDSEVSKAPQTIRGLTLALPIEDGVDLAQAPQWSYNTVVRYRWDLDNFTLTGQAQYSWTDEQYGALADPYAQYGEVDNLGLRLILEPMSEKWQAALWVDNLEDQNSTTYSFTSTEGGRAIYRQRPRSYGVEVTYNF